MLFKISLRNIKKSISNYMIYFITLVLGVAIFYTFNSINDQAVMLKVSDSMYEIITLMVDVLGAVSVFVSVVLGFLIVYASNFLMKRRKKEFGIYMILGMNKKKISAIMVIETVIIGVVSLAIGVGLGIIASQGMSIIIANLFEADMTGYKFSISVGAIIKTAIYFAIMYVVVVILDIFVVGKAKLINLLNAGKRTQKNFAKNPFICFVVFVISVVVLGTAYYSVTIGRDNIFEASRLVQQIAKGIVSTFTLFWSLSGMLLFLVKKMKRFYYKGIRSFGVKELSSKINTTVLSGSIICLLLFLSIFILATAMSMKDAMNNTLKNNVPSDVQIRLSSVKEDENIEFESFMKEMNFDMSKFDDYVYTKLYEGNDNLTYLVEEAELQGMSEYVREVFEDSSDKYIVLSEYNKLAAVFGKKQYELKDDEYMVLADNQVFLGYRDAALKNNVPITIGGKEYHPKYSKTVQDIVEMENAAVNSGIVVLPDSADISALKLESEYFTANYKNGMSESEIKMFESGYLNNTLSPYQDAESKVNLDYTTKAYIYSNSVGIMAIVVFVGIYIGITLLISSAAILALKELSEASDNREKYKMLRKIGVEEKMINRSLLGQSLVFFGAPLALALIHSVVGMKFSNFIFNSIGQSSLIKTVAPTAVILLGIYSMYFIITYICSKKIISE